MEPGEGTTLRIRRRMVLLLALATLLFFGIGGWLLIEEIQHRSAARVVLGERSVLFQLMAGTVAGLVIALMAAWLIDRPFMAGIKHKYAQLIGPLFRHRADVWFVSFCAGVGEEMFFRGAVQHWLGIPATAVLFVAIHGYLDPRSWRMCIYGVLLTIAMIALGSMARHWGLIAPMAAHAVIDVVLLGRLMRAARDHSVG